MVHKSPRNPAAPGGRAAGRVDAATVDAQVLPFDAHSVDLVSALASDESGLDHVVLTGDLTNLSFETEFVDARAVLAPIFSRRDAACGDRVCSRARSERRLLLS